MKLIIEVEKDYYEMIKYNVKHGQEYKPFEIIANGTPYEERPQEHWIITGEEQGALGIIYKMRKCSNCGFEHCLFISDNFCPNCGADMRGEKK